VTANQVEARLLLTGRDQSYWPFVFVLHGHCYDVPSVAQWERRINDLTSR